MPHCTDREIVKIGKLCFQIIYSCRKANINQELTANN